MTIAWILFSLRVLFRRQSAKIRRYRSAGRHFADSREAAIFQDSEDVFDVVVRKASVALISEIPIVGGVVGRFAFDDTLTVVPYMAKSSSPNVFSVLWSRQFFVYSHHTSLEMVSSSNSSFAHVIFVCSHHTYLEMLSSKSKSLLEVAAP